jgi:hypothetical protein
MTINGLDGIRGDVFNGQIIPKALPAPENEE